MRAVAVLFLLTAGCASTQTMSVDQQERAALFDEMIVEAPPTLDGEDLSIDDPILDEELQRMRSAQAEDEDFEDELF